MPCEFMFSVREHMFMDYVLIFIEREQNFSHCKNTSFY